MGIWSNQIHETNPPQPLNTQCLDLHFKAPKIENHPCDVNSSKDIRQNSDAQRDRKSLYRPGPKLIKKDACDQSCQIGINNSRKGPMITLIDCCPNRLSEPQLFFDPFMNQ